MKKIIGVTALLLCFASLSGCCGIWWNGCYGGHGGGGDRGGYHDGGGDHDHGGYGGGDHDGGGHHGDDR